jgi:hypothetical protein
LAQFLSRRLEGHFTTRRRPPGLQPDKSDAFTDFCGGGAALAAVTPIMKLLVVVETLKGILIARSIASAFIAPDPMPSSPDNAPAMNISANPTGTRWT